MEQLKKINFKQPKYILPAILYFPLLFTGYFVIDMFHTEKAEIADPTMQSTEYLNPNLPQAKVKDGLDGKYESMLKSYGKIDDFSAIENIDSEEDSQLEKYESKYTDGDLESMDSTALAAQLKAEEMKRQLELSAERGNSMQDNDMPLALSEKERLIQDEMTASMGVTIASRYSRFEPRKRAIEEINKKFNTNIEVRYYDGVPTTEKEMLDYLDTKEEISNDVSISDISMVTD